ncbi:MAG: Asp-tRNA(Asn)/Glu-tRNA(Gln) amidotransferase subunit GatA [Alphaproteobacteria bacterium]|nr:MAG: Asp-tRNA(Asn)/Glu-tRNA(Gln) amidotransferase subunit GatA [Alphaproteobacteria bacterium]
MSDLTKLSIVEASLLLKEKKISAVELVQEHLNAMDAQQGLNAFITTDADSSLAQARASDVRRTKGKVGLMEGIPIAVKDLFCTKGVRTTAGSRMLENFVPTYESTVTQNLYEAGAVSLGKLNMDEFAMGSANLTSAFGPVINPWKRRGSEENLVPGGSSGGSAACVAAYMAMGATASDTGGSIRQPGAFCGLVAIKPTYGLCSRYGMVAFASSLDQAGPITRTVADGALMLEAMAGYDPKDATSVKIDIPRYSENLEADLRGLKVGIPKEYRIEGLSNEINASWDEGIAWLKEAGAEIIDVSLPHTTYALPVYYVLAPAEASSNLARYDGVRYGHREPGKDLSYMYGQTRMIGFGPEVKRRIMMGTYVLSSGYYDAYFRKAQRVRRLIKEDFDQVWKRVDVILTPSTPNTAFSAEKPPTDPITMYMNDVLTVPVNLAGLPGMSVPTKLSQDGLPLGLQIIAPQFQEQRMLQVACILEKAANFDSYRSCLKGI